MSAKSSDVRDLKPGDYVVTKGGGLEEVESLSPGLAPGKPIPRDFYVRTKSGRTVGMWQARSYHKKEDLGK